jgi:hypothetical protein
MVSSGMAISWDAKAQAASVGVLLTDARMVVVMVSTAGGRAGTGKEQEQAFSEKSCNFRVSPVQQKLEHLLESRCQCEGSESTRSMHELRK